MAAYAALNSVMHILLQIQHHPRPPITLKKQHMHSLCEIITFLQDFLENYSLRDVGGGEEALESRIADAAYAAEDIIESHIVDQILAKSNNFSNLFYRDIKKMIRILADSTSNGLFCRDLQKVIEDMDLIKKEAIEIQEKSGGINDDLLPRNIIPMSANIIGSSTVPPPRRKNINTMVGFDDVLIEIMDRLTGYPTNRQVLPIVGMGGIGKTTLARNVYDNLTIAQHFDIRIWVAISQEYRLRDILLEALSFCQDDENKSSEDKLGDQLYKSLCGRRYLIILDDVWCVEAWEELMLFFPDNNNGSRIMVTTRLSDVSNHFRSHSIMLNFLDEEKSWDLFCKIVFPQHPCCPPELEQIGMKIARNCKGLPLSISVIGGLLQNSEKTRQHWEYIAEHLHRIVNLEHDMHCLKILYLSYNHLPIHLKPCFLYMGVFREDTEIVVSSLIRLWVAEGFLKPIAAKSLEVVAEEYLKDLIDRNLILVSKWGSSPGKVKYCKIHDLLRDLCIREAKKDKFLWVSEEHDFDNVNGIQSQRRISVNTGESKRPLRVKTDESTEGDHIARVVKAVALASLARSLICDLDDVDLLSHRFRLMRVFKTVGYDKNYSLNNIFEFVNSRYLDFKPFWNSISIHLPWDLYTLIIQCDESASKLMIEGDRIAPLLTDIPPEIWKMSQLRHLEIGWLSLPDPPKVPLFHKGDDFILRNLQMLKGVCNLELSEEVTKRIPNIKKLKLSIPCGQSWNYCCLYNFCLLNKLESLYIHSECRRRDCYPLNFAFPHSLKKLTLHETQFLWEDMRMIGSLPHLQVLKLNDNSFLGREWKPIEEEFLCLKFLLIQSCHYLVCWNADRTHFPCLEHLVLRRLYNLKEIPLDIGQIPTLRSIELWECRHSANMSATNLLGEQVEIGNEYLQVLVNGKSQFSSGSL